MFRKNHLSEWVIFLLSGTSLYIVYGLDIKKLLEFILQWTFAVIGFKLLVDYSLIKIVFSGKKIEKILKNVSIVTKKFK